MNRGESFRRVIEKAVWNILVKTSTVYNAKIYLIRVDIPITENKQEFLFLPVIL